MELHNTLLIRDRSAQQTVIGSCAEITAHFNSLLRGPIRLAVGRHASRKLLLLAYAQLRVANAKLNKHPHYEADKRKGGYSIS
jgi:hypothetical protein